MRLITLAVVTGIGIVVGVVMYVSQAVTMPTHQKQQITKVIGGEVIEDGMPPKAASRTRVSEYDAMSPEEYNSKLPEAFRFGLQNNSFETVSNSTTETSVASRVSGATSYEKLNSATASAPGQNALEPPTAPNRFDRNTQIASLPPTMNGTQPAIAAKVSAAPESTRSDIPVMISPAMTLTPTSSSLVSDSQASTATATKAIANHVTTTNGTTVIPVDSPPVTSHPNPHISFETTPGSAGAERGRTKMVVNK